MSKIKYFSFFSSVFLLNMSSAMATSLTDCVPNRIVEGTDGKVYTGITYIIRSEYGRYLDLRQETSEAPYPALSITQDHMGANSCAADSFHHILIDCGNGEYMIRSKFGRYLLIGHHSKFPTHPILNHIFDSNTGQGYMNAMSLKVKGAPNPPFVGDVNYKLKLIPCGDGSFMIRSNQGCYLDMRQERDGRPFPVWSITEARKQANAWAQPSFRVRFIPQNYKLNAVVTNFCFSGDTERLLASATKDIEETTNIGFTNPRSQQEKAEFNFTKTLTQTVSWSINEVKEWTFLTRLNVKVEAKVNFLGTGGGVTAETEFTLGNSSKISQENFKQESESKEFSFKEYITLPPYTNVTLLTLYKKVDLMIPFTANVRIKALGDRLRNDGRVVPNQRLNLEVLRALLYHERYQVQIYKTKGNFVYAAIKGKVSVHKAHDLVFKLDEKKLSRPSRIPTDLCLFDRNGAYTIKNRAFTGNGAVGCLAWTWMESASGHLAQFLSKREGSAYLKNRDFV